jgi:hypothetical protein
VVSKDSEVGLSRVFYEGFPCLACREYLVVGHMYYQVTRDPSHYLCIDCAREQGLIW